MVDAYSEAQGIVFTNELKRSKNEEGKTVFNNKYLLLEKLYSGSLAQVRHAVLTEDPDKHFVLKIFEKITLRQKKEYFRKKSGHGMYLKDQLMKVKECEIASLIAIRGHPNVIQVHEIIDDDDFEDKLVLVMDFCAKGRFLDWNEKTLQFYPKFELDGSPVGQFLSEKSIKSILKDSIEGIEFLHSKGVLHRDLKPQNLLICEDGSAKIIDFGVSKVLETP